MQYLVFIRIYILFVTTQIVMKFCIHIVWGAEKDITTTGYNSS